jgi:hypothetical protein
MFDTDDRCVSLVVIESELLRKAFSNQSGFIFSDIASGVTLDGEDPFDTDGLSDLR